MLEKEGSSTNGAGRLRATKRASAARAAPALKDDGGAARAIGRLTRLLDAEIDALEDALERGERLDPEKRARTLGALARAAEKLAELDRARQAQKEQDDGLESEDSLAELERRLGRIAARTVPAELHPRPQED